MFNNLINIHDFERIYRKILQGQFTKIISKLFSTNKGKVKTSWRHVENPPINWWDIPEVKQRWNLLVSGDANVSHQEYFSKKYFADKKHLQGLSLGCGRGDVELEWAEFADFKTLEAYDLSAPRIDHAKNAAQKRKLNHILKYKIGDVFKLDLPENRYDFVLVEGSLHHFTPLEVLLRKIKTLLKPNGYFFLNEFIGPTRFQWSNRQLEIVNGMLQLLPKQYKKIWNSNWIKTKVHRSGRLWMKLSDPSEAVESSNILPLVRKHFEVIEMKEFGGTVLSLLFSEIAYNFLADDPATKQLLQFCFEIEDYFLSAKEIPSDYVMAMCRKVE